MLEALSNKLSKYLAPQVYSSIFSGRHSVEVSSTRKKLTIFFPTSPALLRPQTTSNPRS